jgi:hypothetical protein
MAFLANNGRKAMKSLDAHGITAKFNPVGVFRRLWQLDEVHVQAGEVGHSNLPATIGTDAKPWYAIFLSERVYLNRVESEPVDVTWQSLRLRHTHLLITLPIPLVTLGSGDVFATVRK